MASVRGLLSGDWPATRRRLLRQRKNHFAPAFGAAAVLISLAAMGLVMWFIGVVGPQVQEIRRGFQSHFAAASAAADAPAARWAAAPAEEPAASEGPPASAGGKKSIAAGDSDGSTHNFSRPYAEETTLSVVRMTTTTTSANLRGFECSSNNFNTAGGLIYSNLTNVTNWVAVDGVGVPCHVVGNRSAEVLIEEDGLYFLYSQAWLSGAIIKGVLLKKVRGEPGVERSLKIRHSIVCWQNCGGNGSRDRDGLVHLRQAEITALDVLNTYVAVQQRLRRGATLGVMVTSLNVTGVNDSVWKSAVLGVVRLS